MKKDLKIIALALIVVFGASCNKSYFDINTNPNKAASATPELVLPNAIVAAASPIVNSNANINGWMGYWAPSGSYAQSASDVASYYQSTSTGYGNWGGYYHNLEDLEYTRTQAIAQNKPFYQGAALILQALDFQELVDEFNNVPFTQALQGTTNIQPAYDKAQTIYETLSTNLGTAVTLMQNPNAITSTASSDVLFGGGTAAPALWAKFANTLRLRILMHQSQMSGRASYIQGEIAKIIANGAGFLTTDAAAKPGYNNNTGQQSPFWGLCINTAGTYTLDYWRANKYPINFCLNNNDPRYQYWYAPISGGGYVGNVLGGANNTVNAVGSASSTFGPGVLKSVSQPAVILSAAESYFLQAEATLYGWLSGGTTAAASLYNAGVAASFNYLGAPLGTYTSQAGNIQTNFAACTTTAQQLACIIRQKYLAMNMVTPMEAWSDYRRLGLPADVPVSVSIYRVGSVIPYRYTYPVSEYNTNETNVTAQGTIDPQASKIFWMP